MINAIKSWFFIFTLIVSVSSFASELTEESVNNLLFKIDNAVVNKNAGVVSDALSDNVAITLNITMQGQTQVLNPSKQEYIALLQQGWSAYEDYQYSKSNVNIDVQGSKAFVTADIEESMSIQGQIISGESKEEVTIEMLNGRPVITNVVGYTNM